jgi:Fe-S-cluster-containing hydrogenase component 2
MTKAICPHNCKDCYAMRTCSLGAISDTQGSINLDTAQCIGCGSCKTACITFGNQTLRTVRPEKWLSELA